jgi:hypothetical protein
MTDAAIIADIMSFVVDSYDFERMVDSEYSGVSASNYTDFLAWNTQCLTELTADERLWVQSLCERIKKNKIRLMDMEPCSAFVASGLFYDKKKNLCIVNPR